MKILIPDTGVLIDGRISELIAKEGGKPVKVAVPNAAVAELEFQANSGRKRAC